MRTVYAAVVCAAAVSVGVPAPALGQARPAAERIAACAACHGEDGNSRTPNLPSLAGQPELFLLTQLILMRDGVRPIPAMAPFVNGLNDSDIQAMASHFTSLPPAESDEPIDTALAERGRGLAASQRCASCHLPNFEGQQQIPRLAKQRIDYLTKALADYRDGKRAGADTLMSNAVTGLSDTDLLALAHFTTAPAPVR